MTTTDPYDAIDWSSRPSIISTPDGPGKLCRNCHKLRPIREFYFVDKARTLLDTRCKTCKYKRNQIRDAVQGHKDHKKHRETHLEAYATASRRYRVTHPEVAALHVTIWKATHPDRVAIHRINRDVRKKGAQGRLTLTEWFLIKERQNYTCLACGRQEPTIALTVDHVIPLVKGGSNLASNIQGLCGPCNSRKHAQTIDYRTEQHVDPQ